MKTHNVVLLTAIVFELSSCNAKLGPEQLVLEHRTSSSYDRVITIDASEFADSRIRKRLMDFIKQNTTLPLARLTISEKGDETAIHAIQDNTPADFPMGFVNPANWNFPSKPVLLAQAFSLAGKASIRIRKGEEVEEHPVQDNSNPIELSTTGRFKARIVSFRTSQKVKSKGVLYWIDADLLPTLAEAEVLRSDLEKHHFPEFADVIIRTDGCFNWQGGPVSDMFQLRRRNLTKTVFLNNSFIRCNSREKCLTDNLVWMNEEQDKLDRFAREGRLAEYYGALKPGTKIMKKKTR